MLLAKEFRVQVGENPSPPPPPPAVIPRGGAFQLGFRARAGAGAGSSGARAGGGFSHESEHDLALMVSDFLENGSSGAESWYSSDSDSGFSDLNHLSERVLAYTRSCVTLPLSCKHAVEQHESDLLSVVHSLILSIDESDLQLVDGGQCNASCIRQSLVKLLRSSGYDAAVCSSKWQGLGKVPGGDHEYIDVIMNDFNGVCKRLIIDIDFQSHFEIARAVESYEAILSSLPVVYVGSLDRLKQFLQVMVEATRCSLKQNSMPLPPWRSLPYVQAKWYSPYERKSKPDELSGGGSSSSDHEQCLGHLRRLKASLCPEIDSERHLKAPTNDKKRRVKSERRRRPSLLSS